MRLPQQSLARSRYERDRSNMIQARALGGISMSDIGPDRVPCPVCDVGYAICRQQGGGVACDIAYQICRRNCN